MIRLPGLIDPHVHVREPGQTHKEDWDTATSAALAGGVTTILAMPNTKPPIFDASTLDIALDAAKAKARCDYAQFVGAGPDNADILSSLAPKAAGLKMYLDSTFGQLRLDDMTFWLEHFRQWPGETPIVTHSESRSMAAALWMTGPATGISPDSIAKNARAGTGSRLESSATHFVAPQQLADVENERDPPSEPYRWTSIGVPEFVLHLGDVAHHTLAGHRQIPIAALPSEQRLLGELRMIRAPLPHQRERLRKARCVEGDDRYVHRAGTHLCLRVKPPRATRGTPELGSGNGGVRRLAGRLRGPGPANARYRPSLPRWAPRPRPRLGRRRSPGARQ